MGGNRFKDAGAVRLSRQAARHHSDRILRALRTVAPVDGRVEATGSLRDKQSFGDIDVVANTAYVAGVGDDGIVGALAAQYGPGIMRHRGDSKDPTMGLLVPTPEGAFHLDVITAAPDAFDFAVRYMSAGDAGILIGGIARQMGCKFGQYGLALLVGHGTRRLGKVVLTTDFDEALEFLGLDPAVHAAGFDNDLDLRAFIMASKWFDPAIYDLARMTNTSRSRALKRPQYVAHVEAFASMEPRGHIWPTRGDEAQMTAWREIVLERFPHARAAVEGMRAAYRPERRLNGGLIEEMTGVREPVLRHLINAVAKEFPLRQLYNEWSETADMEEIKRRFRHYVDNPTPDMIAAAGGRES